MTRRRWVYTQGGKPLPGPVEVTPEYEPQARVEISMDRHYENTCATDGTDIGSRRKHREYMKANNLAMADDFKGEWAKAKTEREAYFQGQHRSKETREVLDRALHGALKRRS